jgi:hypothetical protein
VPAAKNVACHPASHDAKADESNSHERLLFCFKLAMQAVIIRFKGCALNRNAGTFCS